MEKKIFKEIDDIEHDHWWFKGRRKIILGILTQFVRSKKETALDIGFGTGLNAQLLKGFADEIDGLDPSDEAIELAKKNHPNFKVFKGEFPKYRLNKTYDLIIMLDVLEHIDDDIKAIASLNTLLNKGGIAFITVPALPIIWTEHDIVAQHFRRYKLKQLSELVLNHTELRIRKISYFNSFLFLPILFYRVVRKTFVIGKGSSDFYIFPSIINKILYLVFSFESFLLRYIDFPIGVSLMCIVQKNNDE